MKRKTYGWDMGFFLIAAAWLGLAAVQMPWAAAAVPAGGGVCNEFIALHPQGALQAEYLVVGGALLAAAASAAVMGGWLRRRQQDSWLYEAGAGVLLIGGVWMWLCVSHLEHSLNRLGDAGPLLTAAALVVLYGIGRRSPGMTGIGILAAAVPLGITMTALYWHINGPGEEISYEQMRWGERMYPVLAVWMRRYLPGMVLTVAAAGSLCRRRNVDGAAAADSAAAVRFLWIAAACMAAQPVGHALLRWGLALFEAGPDAESLGRTLLRVVSWGAIAAAAWRMRQYGRRLFDACAACCAGMMLTEGLLWQRDWGGLWSGTPAALDAPLASGSVSVCFAAVLLVLAGAELRRGAPWTVAVICLAAAAVLVPVGLPMWRAWLRSGPKQNGYIYVTGTLRAGALLPLTIVDYVLPAVSLAAAAWLTGRRSASHTAERGDV